MQAQGSATWRTRSAHTAARSHTASHRVRRAALRCSATFSSIEAPTSLPLFPLPTVLHPAQSGVVNVFEPRYLDLFRDLQYRRPASLMEQLRFGHLLAPNLAPPALMEGAVGGFPAVGVAAGIQTISQRNDGTLTVEYEGKRRFRLLMVEMFSDKAYMVGTAQWYDDVPPAAGDAQRLTDQLERDVLATLREVAKYSSRLHPSSNSSLPAGVLRYAPPPATPPAQREVHDAMRPAGGSIATWRRHGSVYKDAGQRKAPTYDPYQALSEQLGKERRQEQFSFAAANVLEMGLPERIALLQSQDTAARLQFVLSALQIHLQTLVAQAAMEAAIRRK